MIQIRRENLVDCSVSWQKSLKLRFLKIKLFSLITYFAHLNDFIWALIVLFCFFFIYEWAATRGLYLWNIQIVSTV